MPAQAAAARSENAAGRKTRLRLIRTAERLFAEQGIDAVSLRQISAAAGLRMTHAVAYHFGDRAGLIQAIVEDRIAPIEKRRSGMLAELEREGRTHDPYALAEARIRPRVEALGETGYYFRFEAQLARLPRRVADAQTSGVWGSAPRAAELQDEAALDHLPPTILEQRKRLATQLVVATIADLEARADDEVDEIMVSDLVDCVVALYSTQPSQRTLEAVHAAASGPPATRRKARQAEVADLQGRSKRHREVVDDLL